MYLKFANKLKHKSIHSMENYMNNITELWYVNKRTGIEEQLSDSDVLAHKRVNYESPKGKYTLSITPVVFEEDDRYWAYTTGKIVTKKEDKTGKILFTVFRNSEKFPFVFLEGHSDGHDYLICGEDYQGQTILQLDTGERMDYIGEKAKRNMEFCWQKFHLSPNGKTLAVEGYAKNKPKDMIEYRSIRFFDIKNPLDLPYREVGNRISFHYDSGVAWEDDNHFTISVVEDRRKEDLKRVKDLPEEERMKCLESANYGKRNTVYSVPVDGGEEDIKEVYSEWFST